MNTLPERSEVDGKFRWKLEDLYAGDKEFEEDFRRCEEQIRDMDHYKDTVIQDAGTLLACLDLCERVLCLADNVFTYAKMRMDENNTEPKYQVLTARAHRLLVMADTATSFLRPAVARAEETVLADAALSKYRKFIQDIVRRKAHTLGDQEERILAMSGEATSGPDEIFSMLHDADMVFPEILDENQKPVRVTHGRYRTFLENKSRRVRKDAFDAMYDTFASFKNTLGTAYASSIRVDKFYAEARNYKSSLEAALFDNHIHASVYQNLVDTVNRNLPLLHRYVEIRANIMGLPKAAMYDLYAPLVEPDKSDILYDKACCMVKEGLQVLGREYGEILSKGFDEGWIDVYENKGKTSGAYSWGTYLSHPYVLMNYQGTLDDVFTLAHEMGHSLHSYYSCQAQPYLYSRYKIFVAEVASTVNEILLLKDMLRKSDDMQKACLLNHFLESFRGTVFRQTMFAEFEKEVHGSYWENKPLSTDDICNLYLELNRKHYGSWCEVDEKIKYEWSRIPHFYRSFYVYQYATGFSAAAAIANRIEEEGQPAANRYIDFLKTGDSRYPLDALLDLGVDLNQPHPVEKAIKLFGDLLTEFWNIMKKRVSP